MKPLWLMLVLIVELVVAAVLSMLLPQILDQRDVVKPRRAAETLSPADPSPPRQHTMQEAESKTFARASDGPTAVAPYGVRDVALSYFTALPSAVAPQTYTSTDELTDLGRMLFYDPRLSISKRMSCNTCHLLDRYGVDHREVSLGHTGHPVRRNAPSVYNAALHQSQFWDGRRSTLEEQAKDPILSSAEMGMPSALAVEVRLRNIGGYQELFHRAFPNSTEPLTFDNVAIAIGAFERKLMTPSRFDGFLKGDLAQLDENERRGLAIFIQTGCTDCHLGPAVGGTLYKKLGVVEPYPTRDQGRYVITKAEPDRQVFKVPSLRNVGETGPYLHDGSVRELPEMVRIMARYQLGKVLPEEEVADVVAFLKSLTGDLPLDYIAVPTLP